jgi:2-keto-4-pentenoate hydratase/2-oxohepta-3-ene-1,7-dioic acid hydratase in catechol pathway
VKLVSYELDGAVHGGLLLDGQIVSLAALGAPDSVRELLGALDSVRRAELSDAAAGAERLSPSEVRLLAPVPDAEKIICLGLNYRDHAQETGQEIPHAPMWFGKFRNSLAGDGAPIALPAALPDYVDYEAELAIVIGSPARAVEREDALAHVAGAMCMNDVTARDLQFENPLWTSGKAIDGFAPCGPALVTLDEVADLANLAIETRVNGEVMQRGSTADMIFDVPYIVAWLSRTMTLQPGDIIATGTPAGVGGSRGAFLRDGDRVEVQIEHLGTLTNTVVRA